MGSKPRTAYFHIIGISLQQVQITDEVLTGVFLTKVPVLGMTLNCIHIFIVTGSFLC